MINSTKFILHGGFAPGQVQQDDAFFQEMLKGTPDTAKVLLVYFAEPDEKVQLRIAQDTEELHKNKGTKELLLRVATQETFADDCAWADVVYLHGGKTVRILEVLRQYPQIAQILSGRTIAGDSAGANVLCKYFYSKNSQEIRVGLGILPLKIVAHYQDGTPNPLADTEPELETLLLAEYKSNVITVE